MAGKSGISARTSVEVTSSTSALRRMVEAGLLRELAALSLLLGVAFAILSIASFDPADVSGAVFPLNEERANLGGVVGSEFVAYCYRFFGVATYLMVGLFAIWAGVLFLRKEIKNWPLKLVGAALAITAFSGFFGGMARGSSVMPSGGGIVGTVTQDILSQNFGLTGAYLILSFAAAVSFLLATEAMFYPVIRDLFATRQDEDEEFGDNVQISFEKTDSTVTFAADENNFATGTVPEEKKGLIGRTMDRIRGIATSSRKDSQDDSGAYDAAAGLSLLSNDEDSEDDSTAEGSSADLDTSNAERIPSVALRPAKREKPKKATKKQGKKKSKSEDAADLLSLAKSYENPDLALLEEGSKGDPSKTKREIEQNVQIIVDTLKHFRIDVEVVDIRRGPTITMYEIRPPASLPIKRIVSREGELSMMLQAPKIRILAPIPGKNTIGIEVPNRIRDTVSLKEVVANDEFRAAAKKMQLPIALGLDSEGKPMIRDLARAPHLLIAGTTGSGKSVMQNIILMSLLLSKHWKEVKMVLVDPKCVELTPYQDLGYLAAPVLTDMSKAVGVFEWLVEEMERRYKLFAATRTKKIAEFNNMSWAERKSRYENSGGDPKEVPETMPAIVAMVDELADMMMVNADTRIDELICRIAQKARAAGIHLILATQRPSADVVTGLIKANVPARIGFKLPTSVDSRTIIGSTGAEKLLGMGDMLVDWNDGRGISRAQSAFCDTPEIERVTHAVRTQTVENYLVDTSKPIGSTAAQDEMIGGQQKHEKFDEAVEAVLSSGRASAQYLRSALRVGYNAATTLIMQMELAGIIGPSRGSKEREILMTMDEWQNLQNPPEDDEDEEYEEDLAAAA